jgi:hypothetical protein
MIVYHLLHHISGINFPEVLNLSGILNTEARLVVKKE